jgi:hypothetical protein
MRGIKGGSILSAREELPLSGMVIAKTRREHARHSHGMPHALILEGGLGRFHQRMACLAADELPAVKSGGGGIENHVGTGESILGAAEE